MSVKCVTITPPHVRPFILHADTVSVEDFSGQEDEIVLIVVDDVSIIAPGTTKVEITDYER